MSEDVRDIIGQYQELKAEFIAIHQNVEALRGESMSPAQLKKEINQLEAEKDQLMDKINMFKEKNNTPDFQELLGATSMLRKEQETEAKHLEKQQEQRNQLDY